MTLGERIPLGESHGLESESGGEVEFLSVLTVNFTTLPNQCPNVSDLCHLLQHPFSQGTVC